MKSITQASQVNERISYLQGALRREKIDAYLIPSTDPHKSEYLCDHWQIRRWFSGFTGSAGTLLVTQEQAFLWTDGRYVIQADLELQRTSIEFKLLDSQNNQSPVHWFIGQFGTNAVLGINGLLFSINEVNQIKKLLDRVGANLQYISTLENEIWQNRPPLPEDPIYEYEVKYTGQTRKQKITQVRTNLNDLKQDAYLFTDLADIAWVLNLRGSDIPCNPVFIGCLLITNKAVSLFIDPAKISSDLSTKLKIDQIQTVPYQEFEKQLDELKSLKSIIIDPSTLNAQWYNKLKATGISINHQKSIANILKAQKNETQVSYLKKAMEKDGVALLKLMRWLEYTLEHAMITEYELSRQLNRFRKAQGNYKGESFSAIVGYESNGAIIHYRPQSSLSRPIKPEGILLIDSGGQYLEGTTDITRTFSLGTPSAAQKRHYTLILKGHIALSRAIFPEGSAGIHLDTLARQFLWRDQLDYGHGTGHGVGHFLNVHEGPQSISHQSKSERTTTPLKPGMICSNEPGLYLKDQYGMRIENLILCQKVPSNGSSKQFLKFETLSLYPYELSLINTDLLETHEINWINDYHQEVFVRLRPYLSPEEIEWLEQKCFPL